MGLRGRLTDHLRKKFWWDRVRFIATPGTDAASTAQEAERRLRDVLWSSEFALLGNGNSPPGGNPRGLEVAEALHESLRDQVELASPRSTNWGARALNVLDHVIEGRDVTRTIQGKSVVYRPNPHRRPSQYDLGVWIRPAGVSTDRNAIEFSLHLIQPKRDAFSALLREKLLLETVGSGDWPMTPMERGAIECDELTSVANWYFDAVAECCHVCDQCRTDA
jgi:hypothetical protein